MAERATARRSSGYAVTFAGPGCDAAERMGVLPELVERHIAPDRMDYMRPDGRIRFSVLGPTVRALAGDRSLNILRGDIEDVLYTAVSGRAGDRVRIRFGTSLVGVQQDPDGVDVALDDGTVERADLLVGADGLHSATRRLVFGPEDDLRLDLNHMAGVFMLDTLPDAVEPGVTASLTDTGRTLAVVSLGGDRAVAFFGYRTERPMDELTDEWEAGIRPEAERKQKLGRQVKGLYAPADPFRLWLRELPLRFASYRPVSTLLQRRLQLTS